MSRFAVSVMKGSFAVGHRLEAEVATALAEHLEAGYIVIPKVETCDGEVQEDSLGVAVSAGSGPEFAVGSTTDNPNWLRNRAINLLNIADYIENREAILAAKEAEAEAARSKRRDELARELVSDGAYAYRFAEESLKLAIDRIIELELAA